MPSLNGLDIPAWSGRRRKEALEWVRQSYGPGGRLATDRRGSPCVLCGMPIDYSLREVDDSLSVQHMRSQKHYPHLTWERTNWRPAHLLCNKSAGADNGLSGLGITS